MPPVLSSNLCTSPRVAALRPPGAGGPASRLKNSLAHPSVGWCAPSRSCPLWGWQCRLPRALLLATAGGTADHGPDPATPRCFAAPPPQGLAVPSSPFVGAPLRGSVRILAAPPPQ
eukprot:1043814-Amphidinium_carterae.1